MRLFPKEIDIPLDEGFTAQKDIFNRKAFGDQLTAVVRAVDAPLVMILDAPWGTGKTTFVKMWAGELSKIGIPALYFDAFANDYQKDAFLALASYIIDEIEHAGPTPQKLTQFKDKAFKVAKVLGRSAFRLGIKAATAGLIEAEGLEKAAAETVSALGDEANKAFDEALKTRLESHQSDVQAFAAFRESLGDLSLALAGKGKTRDNGEAEIPPHRKVVFIIDELDRCKPPFALSILESIKHLFAVDGIYFLLVTSLGQIESAVRYAYGQINAQVYLDKFYHLRMQFPGETITTHDLQTSTFARQLGCNNDVIETLEQFSRIEALSLRTIERIVTYLNLATASVPQGWLNVAVFSAPLCILKVVSPPLYDSARKGDMSFDKFDKFFQFERWRSCLDPQSVSRLAAKMKQLWQYILGTSEDDGSGGDFARGLMLYNQQRETLLPYFCGLIDGFRFPNNSV